ncbi:unnamed protein product [Amoebophrya sp. A120]|nr:unnamed protein product [Amoebophrya sp. A120]|eukprot:GSA120T00023506001.1
MSPITQINHNTTAAAVHAFRLPTRNGCCVAADGKKSLIAYGTYRLEEKEWHCEENFCPEGDDRDSLRRIDSTFESKNLVESSNSPERVLAAGNDLPLLARSGSIFSRSPREDPFRAGEIYIYDDSHSSHGASSTTTRWNSYNSDPPLLHTIPLPGGCYDLTFDRDLEAFLAVCTNGDLFFVQIFDADADVELGTGRWGKENDEHGASLITEVELRRLRELGEQSPGERKLAPRISTTPLAAQVVPALVCSVPVGQKNVCETYDKTGLWSSSSSATASARPANRTPPPLLTHIATDGNFVAITDQSGQVHVGDKFRLLEVAKTLKKDEVACSSTQLRNGGMKTGSCTETWSCSDLEERTKSCSTQGPAMDKMEILKPQEQIHDYLAHLWSSIQAHAPSTPAWTCAFAPEEEVPRDEGIDKNLIPTSAPTTTRNSKILATGGDDGLMCLLRIDFDTDLYIGAQLPLPEQSQTQTKSIKTEEPEVAPEPVEDKSTVLAMLTSTPEKEKNQSPFDTQHEDLFQKKTTISCVRSINIEIRVVAQTSCRQHDAGVTSLAWVDARTLVTGSYDEKIRVFDVVFHERDESDGEVPHTTDRTASIDTLFESKRQGDGVYRLQLVEDQGTRKDDENGGSTSTPVRRLFLFAATMREGFQRFTLNYDATTRTSSDAGKSKASRLELSPPCAWNVIVQDEDKNLLVCCIGDRVAPLQESRTSPLISCAKPPLQITTSSLKPWKMMKSTVQAREQVEHEQEQEETDLSETDPDDCPLAYGMTVVGKNRLFLTCFREEAYCVNMDFSEVDVNMDLVAT